jgi:hypothetical protein
MQPLKAYCMIWVRHSNFRHQASPGVSPRESTLRSKACWGFYRPKNPTASAGFEPANLGTKGQHATSRPPKPLTVGITYLPTLYVVLLFLLYSS